MSADALAHPDSVGLTVKLVDVQTLIVFDVPVYPLHDALTVPAARMFAYVFTPEATGTTMSAMYVNRDPIVKDTLQHPVSYKSRDMVKVQLLAIATGVDGHGDSCVAAVVIDPDHDTLSVNTVPRVRVAVPLAEPALTLTLGVKLQLKAQSAYAALVTSSVSVLGQLSTVKSDGQVPQQHCRSSPAAFRINFPAASRYFLGISNPPRTDRRG